LTKLSYRLYLPSVAETNSKQEPTMNATKPTLADLRDWMRDNCGAWIRGEISSEEYDRVRAELVKQEPIMRKFRVQIWWGDEWSYGTVCATEREAMQLASDLERDGATVRIIQE
jgi:hypothetical protein